MFHTGEAFKRGVMMRLASAVLFLALTGLPPALVPELLAVSPQAPRGASPASRQETARVSGRVTGLSTTKGAVVQLQRQAPGESLTRIESPVNDDGSFTLAGVRPGAYSARVIYSGGGPAVEVTVGTEDVTGLVIALPSQRLIVGLVILDGSANPVPRLAVEARGADGRVFSSIHPTPFQGQNTGQAFGFRLEDGEYSVSIRSVPAGYRVQSVTYGTVDLLKSPLKVDGVAPWSIAVRLMPNAQ